MKEIPGYLLGDVLGSGAGGSVYRATATADHPDGGSRRGDRVAVKVISAEAFHGPSGLERWRREARSAARVSHPGVVRVHDTGSDEESAWIVMDELSGPDLRTLLDEEGALPQARAVALVDAIADAVAAVHAAGLVHRDLKPGNVVLDGGVPTVVDFGLARGAANIDPSGSLTASHETSWAHTAGTATTGGPGTAGTFAWMAPEQWRGEPPTAATDVYALGGLLFSCLTGRAPYPKQTLTELAYSVALDAPPLPSEHTGDDRYDGVVSISMAKEPRARFTDAAGFRDAVREVAEGAVIEPPMAATPGTAAPERAPRRPVGRGALTLAGLAAAVVVAGGAWWLTAHGDDSPNREIGGHGPAPGTELTVCAETATLRKAPEGGTEPLEEYRRGTRLTVLDDERNNDSWVKVHAPDGLEAYALTEFSKATC